MSVNGEAPKIPMKCPACAQQWSIPMPRAEMANNLQTSMVTVAHENVTRCPNNKCRQPFMITIASAQLQFQIVPVDDAIVEQLEGSKIVKPALSIVGN